ncbi:MAG TPA: hypothetical protein DC024_06925 [Clostridiales bacterium]|jgi:glycosyltransferase involved in cell wall biosynthesis|nr:hypothetical protein [Clostridiales bacterium]
MEYAGYSVLMSVYKKEKPEYLKLSIESMLNQTMAPSEFVLVEDGPLPDNLKYVVGNFEKKYPNIFHIVPLAKNVGLGSALAIGIQKCKYELIARMDSDDYSAPKRCEEELRCFKAQPALDIVGCFEAEFQNDINNIISIHKVPEKSYEINAFMRRRCALLHPTVIYKKSSVLSCGNYHNVPFFEDYDLFIRMLKNHAEAYNIQKPLYFMRVNNEFFKRRGGISYLKIALQFKSKQYKNGYYSLKDYIISAGGQTVVCLLPNSLRIKFYKYFLR